jgi:hypothetical protein
MSRVLRLLVIALLCAAALWTVSRLAHEAVWARSWTAMPAALQAAALALCAVTLLPFALLAAAAMRAPSGHRFTWVAAIAIVTVGVGAFAIWQALDVARGDQRGLIFLFVPPVQLVGAVLALALSLEFRGRGPA